ncbi:MAG TPA: LAGLIDADG family homing endonuclease [Candidatus Hodarchaeales archaeon]|nr:LAGLIDADG family homing endonuclease [Candidatus Hodarchaeales archaeon]
MLSKEELAYISGFLDGDGCIMLQLIYRHDYVLGYQIRASIVFYQNQKNVHFLEWVKKKLIDGYIRHRNDQMVEYTIVGTRPVMRILHLLSPYLRLKKEHAKLALSILERMPGSGRKIEPRFLLKLAKEVDKFAYLNYSKKRKNTSSQVEEFFKTHNLLNPVETDP